MLKLQTEVNNYTVSILGYQLHFGCKYVENSTEAIVFFHGLAGTWDTFKYILDKDYFPDKSFLFIDYFGFGDSAKPENFSYSMQAQAKIVEELLTMLPKWDIHIVVHSMGSAIALCLSDEILNKAKSFTNIEGNLIAEDCGLMSLGIAEKTYEEYKNGLYKMHLFAFDKHEQIHYRQSTAYAVYHSAVALVKESESGRLLEKFKSLNCKKIYFYGEENSGMPVLKKLYSIECQMITNSGHAMTFENPEEFYEKLVKFIENK
jgi:pimeloyl-ACP methyl ester carboxylesterase